MTLYQAGLSRRAAIQQQIHASEPTPKPKATPVLNGADAEEKAAAEEEWNDPPPRKEQPFRKGYDWKGEEDPEGRRPPKKEFPPRKGPFGKKDHPPKKDNGDFGDDPPRAAQSRHSRQSAGDQFGPHDLRHDCRDRRRPGGRAVVPKSRGGLRNRRTNHLGL